jgi:hypothetical protein
MQALDRAADEDRNAAAEAIRTGAQIPADESAAAAQRALTEAAKLWDRTDIAFGVEASNFERAVRGLRHAEIAALDARIAAAGHDAAAAMVSFRDGLTKLVDLRQARTWFAEFPRQAGHSTRQPSEVSALLQPIETYIAEAETPEPETPEPSTEVAMVTGPLAED